jgi:nicotinate-nucleotide adenylyltransferase
MDYTLFEDQIEVKYLSRLSHKRADHCRRTADFSRSLAVRYSVDPDKAYLAGLCHDLAKEKKDMELLQLAILYKPEDILDDERKLPLLLHGRAAAGMLIQEMNFTEDEILDSITWHITGNVGMTDLAKVIYCSDFLEPGRRFITDSFRKEALSGDLDQAVKAVLISLLDHRKIKKHKPCLRERELMESYGVGVHH